MPERCLMNEHIRASGTLDSLGTRSRITRVHQPTARSRRTHEVGGPNHFTVDDHILPSVKSPEEGPFRHTRRPCAFDIEASGTIVLDERPSDRYPAPSMLHGKGVDTVLRGSEPLASGAFHDLHRKRDAIVAEVHCLMEHVLRAGRAENRERICPILECHRAKQPRDAEKVVRVRMADEDRLHAEPGLKAHHLALGPLTAVEEKEVTLSLDGDTAHVPANRWSGSCSTEKSQADHRTGCSTGSSGRPAETWRGVRQTSRVLPDPELEVQKTSGLWQATLIKDSTVGHVSNGCGGVEPAQSPTAPEAEDPAQR